MTELYWQPGQHLSGSSTPVTDVGAPRYFTGAENSKQGGLPIVAARPASSPRKDRLQLLRGGAATTLFSLHVPHVTEPKAFARILTALVDSLESFWEDSEILLHLGCAAGEGAAIAAAIPRIPRLRTDVTEAPLATSKRHEHRKDQRARGEEHARLIAAAGSAADLICLLDAGVFPIRPLSTLSLLDWCLDRQRREVTDTGSQLRPVHFTNSARAASDAGTIEAAVKVSRQAEPGSVLPEEAARPSGASLLLREELRAALAQSDMLSSGELLSAIDLASGGPATPGRVNQRQLAGVIDGAACSAAYGRGWLRQPWTDPNAPFFMQVPEWHLSDVEMVVSHVYAALHR